MQNKEEAANGSCSLECQRLYIKVVVCCQGSHALTQSPTKCTSCSSCWPSWSPCWPSPSPCPPTATSRSSPRCSSTRSTSPTRAVRRLLEIRPWPCSSKSCSPSEAKKVNFYFFFNIQLFVINLHILLLRAFKN